MPRARLTATLLTVTAVVALTAAPASAGTPVPKAAVAQPSGVEPLSPYEPQNDCDATAKPGTAALMKLLLATYPGTTNMGITSTCAAEGMISEHADGRALDWGASVFNTTQHDDALAFLRWLTATDSHGNVAANARRLGVMYVIYNKQIWGTWSLKWEPYSCSGVTGCHEDHVHISLNWDGAWKRTSFWSGKVVGKPDYGTCWRPGSYFAPHYTTVNYTPCPKWTPIAATSTTVKTMQAAQKSTYKPGAKATPIGAAQQVLGGLAISYTLDSATVMELKAFQERHGLSATGTLDPTTWQKLIYFATGGKAT